VSAARSLALFVALLFLAALFAALHALLALVT
jgi:hypothetical protein